MLISLKQIDKALEWMIAHMGATTSLIEAKKQIGALREEQPGRVIETGVLRA